ncbi:hypothetical protein ACVWYH_005727 [Bradyrhizobium sp. GM24.11]
MKLETQEEQSAQKLPPVPPARPSLRKPVADDLPTGDGDGDGIVARVPMPQERAPERRTVEAPENEGDRPQMDADRSDAHRTGSLRRRPLTSVLGLILVVMVTGLGFLYWDYDRHFETTDDAFIAARQFSIAPKVTGYITAVPVTDNQHVAAGDVIARIDDRDYRIALAQAQAQVAAAQASIHNIDAQISVQEAQINAGQAQMEQAQAGLVFAQQQAARYEDLAQRGAGHNSERTAVFLATPSTAGGARERAGDPEGGAAPA